MKKIKVVLLGLFLLGVTCVANASVIDLGVTNGINYFQDDVSNLTWVDVNYFVDSTYTEVETWTNGQNFSIATRSQLEALHVSAGTNYAHNASVMGDLPWSNLRIIWGLYDDSGSIGQSYQWGHEDYWSYPNSAIDNTTHFTGRGAWVVATDGGSSVPVPTTIFLFASGLLGLAGVSRKKR